MSKAILEIRTLDGEVACFTEEAVPLLTRQDLKRLGISRRDLRQLFVEAHQEMREFGDTGDLVFPVENSLRCKLSLHPAYRVETA
jgi:hypothetical protein